MNSRLAVARMPMVRDYGFLIRFLVLFAIWAKAAFDYKLMMDQSWRGLFVTIVFFCATILVFVGYKTRIAMLVLAAVMVLHGVVFHHAYSIVGATLAAFAALLPIGDYYSVDRYLRTSRAPAPYEPSARSLATPLPVGFKALFAALLVLNIGGPLYNQVFHHQNRMFQSWDMFHVIGRNLINVRFFRGDDRERGYVDYLDVLGEKPRSPELWRQKRASPDMRILGTARLDDVITRLCRTIDDPASLRLDAQITTLKHGWLHLYQGDPICDASGRPRLKTYPPMPESWLEEDEGEGV